MFNIARIFKKRQTITQSCSAGDNSVSVQSACAVDNDQDYELHEELRKLKDENTILRSRLEEYGAQHRSMEFLVMTLESYLREILVNHTSILYPKVDRYYWKTVRLHPRTAHTAWCARINNSMESHNATSSVKYTPLYDWGDFGGFEAEHHQSLAWRIKEAAEKEASDG